MQVRSLGWEDPLEEEMATHSSILAWRIPTDREAWCAIVHRAAKSWMDMTEHEHTHTSRRALRCVMRAMRENAGGRVRQ